MLAEPEENNGIWQLNILLQGKEKPDLLVYWEPDTTGFEENMPAGWPDHLERVGRDIKKWTGILPWLAAGQETESDRSGKVPAIRRELSELEAWEFLSSGSIQLVQAGYTVFLPGWWEEVQKNRPLLKVKTRSSVGSWEESCVGISQIFQFDWKLAVGDLELTEEEFRRVIEKKQRLVQIRGRWIQIDPAFLRKVQQFVRKKKGLSLGEILQMHFTAPLPAPQEEQENSASAEDDLQVELELSGQLAQMVEQLTRLSTVPIVDTAASFQGVLRNYQRTGASWLLFMRRFGLGSCLADDMGLGKTIQWIAYLLKVKESEGQTPPSLLICPTSVLGNWMKELERFAPSLKVYLHYGPRRLKGEDFTTTAAGTDLVLTSYNLAHMDEEEFCSVEWDCICLDEAQNIKNAYTRQATAVRKFKGRHRIAMTGTPMENPAYRTVVNIRFLKSRLSGKQRGVQPPLRQSNRAKKRQARYRAGAAPGPAVSPPAAEKRPGHRAGPAGKAGT